MHRWGVVSAALAVVFVLTVPPAEAALSITAPPSVNLGSRTVGAGTITGQVGTVTVTSTALLGSWTATVSSTNCVTGAGASFQTVSRTRLSYWSGPATATTGLLSLVTPGQATAANAVTLAATRTAFSATTLNLGTSTLSFNPTLIVNVPATVVTGTYTCTLTHSVA